MKTGALTLPVLGSVGSGGSGARALRRPQPAVVPSENTVSITPWASR